jgi:hypothetical protein
MFSEPGADAGVPSAGTSLLPHVHHNRRSTQCMDGSGDRNVHQGLCMALNGTPNVTDGLHDVKLIDLVFTYTRQSAVALLTAIIEASCGMSHF